MCFFWYRKHTCGHLSERPIIDMCKPGRLSNTICQDIDKTKDTAASRGSHFPCFNCIRDEYRMEVANADKKTQEEVQAAARAAEKAAKEKAAEQKRLKEERVRKLAVEKATREREEEARREAEMKKEKQRSKEEGGTWTESTGRKGKGRKGLPAFGERQGSNHFQNMPMSAGLYNPGNNVSSVFASRVIDNGPKSASLVEGSSFSGRAGVWGPTKILTRKENEKKDIDKVDTKWQ